MAQLEEVTQEANGLLNRIHALFKPETKITLLVRTPGHDEADFSLSNDDLTEAIRALERRLRAS
jgi:hypothetical protein